MEVKQTAAKQNQRGGDVTGWKGGLQNKCQFIEAQPHSHNQHVLYWFEWWRNSIYFWLRNLEWWEWKSTYTKYQRLTMGKLQWCYFCLMPDINKNKLFFRFKLTFQTNTHTFIHDRNSCIMTRINGWDHCQIWQASNDKEHEMFLSKSHPCITCGVGA